MVTDGESRCEIHQAGGADGVGRASDSLIDSTASNILKNHARGGPQAMVSFPLDARMK